MTHPEVRDLPNFTDLGTEVLLCDEVSIKVLFEYGKVHVEPPLIVMLLFGQLDRQLRLMRLHVERRFIRARAAQLEYRHRQRDARLWRCLAGVFQLAQIELQV